MKREQGFSTVEVLIATLVTLILLAGTLGVFNDALKMNEKATAMTDLDQNLRAGINLVIRDFVSAGWGIPTGGIPVPSGTGAAPITRPGPPGTSYTFGNILTLAAVNPGAALGPVGNGRATDIVNILYADSTLPLNETPLPFIAPDGSSITVDDGTPITGISNPIRSGDLIAFSNALGNTLQCVTGVSGQTIYFNSGDPFNLNQPSAPQGNIMRLQSAGVFPPTTASRAWMVTFYLDFTTDADMPRLIRRVNNRPGNAIALVLEDMQLSYDLVDGVTNPTNIKAPVAPNSPNQIRKVNIMLSGRSSSEIRDADEYLRRSLTTQVSLRSLSFIDRYR